MLLAASRCVAFAEASEPSRLLKLTAAKFPNLTHCERAMLEHADVESSNRGEFAVCGPSANPADASNDPAHADEWDAQRSVRAEIIRWMCVEPAAREIVDPSGISILGAKVVGPIDLAHVRVPFAISLRSSSVQDLMNLEGAEIPNLDLRGSYTQAIRARSVTIPHELHVGEGFHAHGLVDLDSATIGDFYAPDGHFEYQPSPDNFNQKFRPALTLVFANIKGVVFLTAGFEARGGVMLYQARVGGDFDGSSGHFSNPSGSAIEAWGANIGGGVFLSSIEVEQEGGASGGPFRAEGLVDFLSAHVGTDFVVNQADFAGSTDSPGGLKASTANVKGLFWWQDVSMGRGATLDLRGSALNQVFLEERSWPSPGNLLVDGLNYSKLDFAASSPGEAATGLKWLALQPPPYHPQPYRQFATALAEKGDEVGAMQVRIASEDLRYSRFRAPGRIWGAFLKNTIGYGHRPMLTIMWSLAVVLFGWIIVRVAKAASLMRPTYPENAPAANIRYERLYPLLYSLDVFLPFVNLHQEHYWWPDAEASGRFTAFGRPIELKGSFVLYYLWAQIIAGWLLSAIFVAGVTGLMRSD